MPALILTFSQPLNTSVQVGDMAYYCPPTANECTQATIVQMGLVTILDRILYKVTIDIDPAVQNPGLTDFILFSKDAVANISSLKGYFAKATFRNNATEYAELFSVSSDTHESSK
jgi:hypothetical protein